jgi:hypothetical protein
MRSSKDVNSREFSKKHQQQYEQKHHKTSATAEIITTAWTQGSQLQQLHRIQQSQ